MKSPEIGCFLPGQGRDRNQTQDRGKSQVPHFDNSLIVSSRHANQARSIWPSRR